jgi:hypothetical protein
MLNDHYRTHRGDPPEIGVVARLHDTAAHSIVKRDISPVPIQWRDAACLTDSVLAVGIAVDRLVLIDLTGGDNGDRLLVSLVGLTYLYSHLYE